MFARTLKICVTGAALVVGTACKNDGPDDWRNYTVDTNTGVARGAGVIPAPAPADTSARASALFNTATRAYMYSVTVALSGTIDSIALYEAGAGATLPASATAILCAGAAACVAASGTATIVSPATLATIKTSILKYST